jgi:hypothetical protein
MLRVPVAAEGFAGELVDAGESRFRLDHLTPEAVAQMRRLAARSRPASRCLRDGVPRGAGRRDAGRRSYAIAGTAGVAEPAALPDHGLPTLFDDPNDGQCLH